MVSQYEKIIQENLTKRFSSLPEALGPWLDAEKIGKRFHLTAFGEACAIGPDGITFSGKPCIGPQALLVSLYALHAGEEPIRTEPFKSFRDLPGSAPYQGAFSVNAERVLLPHVLKIKKAQDRISEILKGMDGGQHFSADFSLIVYPLSKIALAYIFYLPDEEFPASATCLFSSNALTFMPLDGLADVAEYTSRKIIDIANHR